ncbi:MAG TPA: glycine cleavage system aminomethyltransferase GcvT [Dehalococcoidia bacterium]
METHGDLRHLPLEAEHRRQGARMQPFAGWLMPFQYQGILEEHRAVRTRSGLFDVSHMGRFFITGPDAARFLRGVLTFNVHRLAVGQAHYALLCNEAGGILDDVFLYRQGEQRYMLVVNAARAATDLRWLQDHLPPDADVRLEDRTDRTVMLALQGPGAVHNFGAVLSAQIAQRLPPRHLTEIELYGYKAVVARTGYTGEDGFEFVCAPQAGHALWDRLMQLGVQPCGLGARDSLRLEAALPLYGNDIDETVTPYEAGLGWTVDLEDGGPFVGREALARAREEGPRRRLVCLRGPGGRTAVPRHGYPILQDGRAVGTVTSGGYSPTLDTVIAMGYVPAALAAPGTALAVDVRGRPLPMTVVKRPFYRAGRPS